jgi:hypothetical protein
MAMLGLDVSIEKFGTQRLYRVGARIMIQTCIVPFTAAISGWFSSVYVALQSKNLKT